MATDEKIQSDSQNFIQSIQRKKWLIFICILGTLTPVIYFTLKEHPLYESTTLIVCEENREPLPNLGIPQTYIQSSFVMIQMKEIESRSLISDIFSHLQSETIRSFPIPNPIPNRMSKKEWILITLQKNVTAKIIQNSEMIEIRVKAYTPHAASDIANTLTAVLKEKNYKNRVHEIRNSHRLIDYQLARFKKEIDDAEKSLMKYKERNNITSLSEETEAIITRITDLEVEYNRSRTARAAAEERLALLHNQLGSERMDLVPNIIAMGSPGARKLKEKLVDLNVQLTMLSVQNYPDNHPKVISLQKQIEETKSNLKLETLKIAKGESVLDPISNIQKLLEEITSLKIEIHTYKAKENAYEEVLADYDQRLRNLPQKEFKLDRLIRDKTVKDNIYTLLLQKREEAKIQEAERTGNIRVIDPAVPAKIAIRPKKILNVGLGLLLGLFLGTGLAIYTENHDLRIKTEIDIEKFSNLDVIGTIPRIKGKHKLPQNNNGNHKHIQNSKLIPVIGIVSPAAEAFRMLRTNIQAYLPDHKPATILLTSANPAEGKSLIAANLAIVMTQIGHNTLLIDADLRKPVQHRLFNFTMQPGFVNMIQLFSSNQKSYQNKWHGDIKTSIRPYIHSTGIKHLYLMTSGPVVTNPSEILASNTANKVIQKMKEYFTRIIIDIPPVNAVTDATVLARKVDGIVFVLRSGWSNPMQLRHAMQLLSKTDHKIIGAVLNEINQKDGYYSNHYYHTQNQNDKALKSHGKHKKQKARKMA